MLRAVSRNGGQSAKNTFTGDNTGATDVTAELQAFIEAAGDSMVYLPEGTYYTRSLDPLTHMQITGLGKGATFVYDSDAPAIEFNKGNSLKNLPSLASPIIGDSRQDVLGYDLTVTGISTGSTTTVTFSGAHGLRNGDFIIFSDIVGTTELNGNMYVVYNNSSTQIRLLTLNHELAATSNAYVSGGTGKVWFKSDTILDGYDVHPRIAVADASGYRPGDIIHVYSDDTYPSDSDSQVRPGEALTVLWVDYTNNYIYPYGDMQCKYAYKTTPYVTRYKCEQKVYLENIKVSARTGGGEHWEDHTISPREAAIDIYGVPNAVLKNVSGEKTFGQVIVLRGCPYAIVENEKTINVPNIETYDPGADQYTITAITKASPAVVTYSDTAQRFSVGDFVVIHDAAGMTEINSTSFEKLYQVSAVGTVSAGSLYSVTLTNMNNENIDSTGYGTYTSGGKIGVADVDGLGYGVSFYAASGFSKLRNSIFRQCRHAFTTDGRGDDSHSATEWFLYGVPTNILIDNCISEDTMGPGGDSHYEIENLIVQNCTFRTPSRGYLQAGSYVPIGFQIRAREAIIRNCFFEGGTRCLRIAGTSSAFSTGYGYQSNYLVENCNFRNTMAADDTSDFGILLDDRNGFSYYTTITMNNNMFTDIGVPVRVGKSIRVRGKGNSFVRSVNALDVYGAGDVILFDSVGDYQGYKRKDNTARFARLRSDATYYNTSVKLYGLKTIQMGSSMPAAIFYESDTTAAKTYDIDGWINIAPSGGTETALVAMNSGTSTSLQQATGRTGQQGNLYRNQAQAAFTLSLPIGCVIEDIIIRNKTANAVTGGIKVGTSAGGTQILTALAVGASAFVSGKAYLSATVFSATAAQTLYFDAVTGWNSAVLDVTVIYKRGII